MCGKLLVVVVCLQNMVQVFSIISVVSVLSSVLQCSVRMSGISQIYGKLQLSSSGLLGENSQMMLMVIIIVFSVLSMVFGLEMVGVIRCLYQVDVLMFCVLCCCLVCLFWLCVLVVVWLVDWVEFVDLVFISFGLMVIVVCVVVFVLLLIWYYGFSWCGCWLCFRLCCWFVC